MPKHVDISYDQIHAIGYIQLDDPGAIGAGRAWVDASVNPAKLYVRNLADDGWYDMNVTFQVVSSDTAPDDDATAKKVTVQKLAAPPTNAAYVAFSNNPGSDVFYLVLEEA